MSGTGVLRPHAREGRRRRSIRLGPVVTVSLAVLAIGWSLLWVFARHAAGNGFDTWLAAERSQGRVWSCPDRTIDGFPLSIVVRCQNPTFHDGIDPEALHGTLAGITATTQLYFPTNVVVDLSAPAIVAERSTGTTLTMSWSTAHVSLRGDMPGDLDRGQFEAENLSVTPAGGNGPTRVDHVELGFKPLAGSSGSGADVSLKIAKARNPEADAALGSSEPIDATVSAIISALPSGSVGLPAVLDAWRTAGGDVQIKSYRFSKGSFVAAGDGHVELDDEHRLAGRLETRFSGLAPVAARFGIPLAAVKVGSLLSGLLGGRKSGQPEPEPSELSLPLVARNGRLSVGPVKTEIRLDPLY